MDVFDFGIGWPQAGDTDDLFIQSLKAECTLRKLTFGVFDDTYIGELTNDVKKGKLKVGFYLDMASEIHDTQDPFTRFCYALKDAGTRIIDDPDDVRVAADKSITHFDLSRAKIPVPYTVVIRNWEPTRRLTDEEKRGLGSPFIMKPALGYAQRGVKVIPKRSVIKEIAEARSLSEGDNFLLQEMIDPKEINGGPAWFRVYHVFGEIVPCWWNPQTHVYRQVTLKEMNDHALLPLARIVAEIARVTRIDWFSCEIAVDKRNDAFVVIDYMNDQCAVEPQSKEEDGVPDDVIRLLAGRLAEKAAYYLSGQYTLTHRTIWFPKIQIKDENA